VGSSSCSTAPVPQAVAARQSSGPEPAQRVCQHRSVVPPIGGHTTARLPTGGNQGVQEPAGPGRSVPGRWTGRWRLGQPAGPCLRQTPLGLGQQGAAKLTAGATRAATGLWAEWRDHRWKTAGSVLAKSRQGQLLHEGRQQGAVERLRLQDWAPQTDASSGWPRLGMVGGQVGADPLGKGMAASTTPTKRCAPASTILVVRGAAATGHGRLVPPGLPPFQAQHRGGVVGTTGAGASPQPQSTGPSPVSNHPGQAAGPPGAGDQPEPAVAAEASSWAFNGAVQRAGTVSVKQHVHQLARSAAPGMGDRLF